MKSINELLKQSYQYADKTNVKLQLHVPLGKLRDNAKLLSSMGVSQVTVDGPKKAGAKQKKAKATTKKKTVTESKKPAAKKKKAPAKKQAAVKKTTVGKRAKSGMVTQEAVLQAIKAKNHTPQAIAQAMKANPIQVGKALSRYTQKGIIKRTKPGHYAL